MTRIAIVGGGLAGISAARHAIAHGFEIDIFESGAEMGGRLRHKILDSCVIDRGFQVVNVNYPELKKLIPRKNLSSKPMFVKLSYVDAHGRRRDISPFNLLSLLSPASGSMGEKFRFARYLLSNSPSSTTLLQRSVDFPVLYERILKPFLNGVFLTDPATIRGDIAKRILKSFLLGRPHLIDGGVGNLITALIQGIPENSIHLQSRVKKLVQDSSSRKFALTLESSGRENQFEGYDFVIIATNGRPDEIIGAKNGNAKEWISSATVYHKINKLQQPHRKLYLGGSFVNSLVASDANSTYANSSYSLIATTFLGEMTDATWDQNRAQYEGEIAELYNCDPKDLTLISIESVSHSLPLFSSAETQEPSYLDPLNDQILYAGDSFDEPSQNAALRSGRRAIEELIRRAQ